MKRRSVVTAIGLTTGLGVGCTANNAALSRGASAVQAITRFETTHLSTRFAAPVDTPDLKGLSPPARTEALAQGVLAEAMAMANLDTPTRANAALFAGLPPLQIGWPERYELAGRAATASPTHRDLIAHAATQSDLKGLDVFRNGRAVAGLAERNGIGGPTATVSTACSSGSTALIMAVNAIEDGAADVAIALGADASLSPEMIARFSKLSALSTHNENPPEASRPFGADRDGFVPGEGAAALVLESAEHATARGTTPLAIVSGTAEVVDGSHRLRHQPDADRIIAVILAALEDAGLNAAAIDHINTHGTATPENDWVEYLGCRAVFGDRLASLPVSALKSMIGHTLSASGTVEAAAVVMMLRDQVIYPTINCDPMDPSMALDIVVNSARKTPQKHVLSNSFGFGGQNCAIILSRP